MWVEQPLCQMDVRSESSSSASCARGCSKSRWCNGDVSSTNRQSAVARRDVGVCAAALLGHVRSDRLAWASCMHLEKEELGY